MGGVVPASDLGGYGRAWGGWWSEPPYSMHFGPDGGGMVTFLVYPPDDLVLVVTIQWLGRLLRLGAGQRLADLGPGGQGHHWELRWALESLLDYSVFMGLGFNLGSRRCGASVFAASFGRKPYGAATPALGGPGARPAAVPAVSRRVGARDDRLGRAVPANGHMASGAAQAPRNQSNQT